MFNWEIIMINLLVFIILLQSAYCEVTLRVLLQPPMASLECLITNPGETTSVFIMCPNDVMCFKSCNRLCEKDCTDNAIICTEKKFNNGLLYTYTFDTTNTQNQGEWSCHYGADRSSTVLFFNETKPIILQLIKSKVTTSKSQSEATAKIPLPIRHNSESSTVDSNLIKGYPILRPIYVIIILSLFALSLCLNILCIIRSIFSCLRLSSKRSEKQENLKEKSCFHKLCIKFFCMENLLGRHYITTNHSDANHLLSRQVSDVYDLHRQPDLLIDNIDYSNPAANRRLLTQSMFTRSQSFPSKTLEQRSNLSQEVPRVYPNSTIPRRPFQIIPRQETVSQTIYDDVADQIPQIAYIPYTGCYFNIPINPNNYMSTANALDRRISNVAASMNNLANFESKLSEMVTLPDDSNEESALKSAISSRVELSKEMISQADTLLRRAGSLLYDKGQTSDNSKTENN